MTTTTMTPSEMKTEARCRVLRGQNFVKIESQTAAGTLVCDARQCQRTNSYAGIYKPAIVVTWTLNGKKISAAKVAAL